MIPEDLPLWAAIGAFGSILLVFAGVFFLQRYRVSHRKMIARIKLTGTDNLPEQGGGLPTAASVGIRVQGPVVKLLGKIGERVTPEKGEKLRRKNLEFMRAGIRTGNASAILWGIKLVLAFSFTAGFLGMNAAWKDSLGPQATLTGALFFVFIGFYLPNAWLQGRIRARKTKIREGLPDALDLLVVCVEAGMGLDAAINRVGKEISLVNPPLSEEFRLFNLEMRAGKSRTSALRGISLRTDIEEVNSMVTILIQSDKFGTSVAQALRVYSDAFRLKRFMMAEEMAAKLPVKLLFPLILFILPSLLVALIGPAVIQVFRAFSGN